MRSRLVSVRSRAAFVVALAVLAIGWQACAARGPRNQSRVAALTVGEAALGISRMETQLYRGNVYAKDVHDTLSDPILKVLYAARGFERAVAAWPEGADAPATVEAAKQAVLVALADLEHVVPTVAAARDPLLRAIAAVRAALADPLAGLQAVPPVQAEMPPGGLLAFLALVNVLGSLFQSGRTTFDRIKAALKAEGATDEELATLDAALSEEIAAREAERSGS